MTKPPLTIDTQWPLEQAVHHALDDGYDSEQIKAAARDDLEERLKEAFAWVASKCLNESLEELVQEGKVVGFRPRRHRVSGNE